MREPYVERRERRVDRAAQHFCDATGSTVYCELAACPYCGGEGGAE